MACASVAAAWVTIWMRTVEWKADRETHIMARSEVMRHCWSVLAAALMTLITQQKSCSALSPALLWGPYLNSCPGPLPQFASYACASGVTQVCSVLRHVLNLI